MLGIRSHKQRHIMCKVYTDDLKVKDIELEAKRGCLLDDDREWGFLIDPDDMFRDKTTGVQYQIISEKSIIPICMIHDPVVKESELGNIIDQLFAEDYEARKQNQFNIAKKNTLADKLVLIVTIFVSAFLVMFAMNFFWG